MKSLLQKIALFILTLAPFWAMAQVDFAARVNSRQVAAGEMFAVEYSVNVKGQNFKPPRFNGFEMLAGPSTSMSTYMDNTGMRFKMSYTYTLRARSKGSFTIGPAFINYEGKTYKTNALDIEVLEEKAPAPDSPEAQAKKNVFFKPLLSKSTVYQGEPIFGHYKLYFRNDIGNPQLTEEPNFTGFYKEDILQKRITTQKENYDNQSYTTADIRQMVLIPQKSGTLNLGEVVMEVPASLPTGRYDIFGRPIGRTVNLNLKESFPTLTVKPLPLAGQPQDFSGAVGNFQFEASLSQNEITTDESVTLRLDLKGTGNIKLASLPKVDFPNAFEVFDPERKESSSVGTYGMRGSKILEYLLVPRYSGTYKIGPIRFSYFNPTTQRYQTISSPVFEVTVTGGQAPPQGAEGAGIAQGEKEAVKFIGKDILFIKTNADNWRPLGNQFLGSVPFYVLLGAIGLLFLGLLAFYKIRSAQGKNQSLRRSQKASKMARKHLTEAKKALKTQNADSFYTAIAAALWGYLGDKLGIAPSQMSKELIEEKLNERGLEPVLVTETLNRLNQAEMARYTGTAAKNLKEDYQATAALLTQIEKQV
jgi:hypothetical protein